MAEERQGEQDQEVGRPGQGHPAGPTGDEAAVGEQVRRREDREPPDALQSQGDVAGRGAQGLLVDGSHRATEGDPERERHRDVQAEPRPRAAQEQGRGDEAGGRDQQLEQHEVRRDEADRDAGLARDLAELGLRPGAWQCPARGHEVVVQRPEGDTDDERRGAGGDGGVCGHTTDPPRWRPHRALDGQRHGHSCEGTRARRRPPPRRAQKIPSRNGGRPPSNAAKCPGAEEHGEVGEHLDDPVDADEPRDRPGGSTGDALTGKCGADEHRGRQRSEPADGETEADRPRVERHRRPRWRSRSRRRRGSPGRTRRRRRS